MRAAANEIYALQILEAVVRAEVQHLVEAVREIEGGAAVDGKLVAPIVGGQNALRADAAAQVLEAQLLQPFQNRVAERLLFRGPIDLSAMADGDENIKRRSAVAREKGVGSPRVSDIDRRFGGDDIGAFDLRDILLVVLRQKYVVVDLAQTGHRFRDTA